MKKVSVAIAIMFVLGLFLAQPVAAQLQQQYDAGKMQKAFRLSELMDKTVKGQQGEELGEVKDVVVGEQGNFAYVVVSGENDKLYPIPISAFQRSAEEDKLVVNLTQNQLQNAPSFAEGQWPDLGERHWEQRIHGYYGQELMMGVPGEPMQPQQRYQPGYGPGARPGMEPGLQPGTQPGMEFNRPGPDQSTKGY